MIKWMWLLQILAFFRVINWSCIFTFLDCYCLRQLLFVFENIWKGANMMMMIYWLLRWLLQFWRYGVKSWPQWKKWECKYWIHCGLDFTHDLRPSMYKTECLWTRYSWRFCSICQYWVGFGLLAQRGILISRYIGFQNFSWFTDIDVSKWH